MIPYQALATLRLKDFLSQAETVEEVDGWEFMDRIWVGEACGFTEWLRLREDPAILRSVSLDLAHLDRKVARHMLERLQLPLQYGMQTAEVHRILGNPVGKLQLVNTRITYDYVVGEAEQYTVSATIHQRDGLIYLLVMTKEE